MNRKVGVTSCRAMSCSIMIRVFSHAVPAVIPDLTNRLYPYCQGIAARQLTDFPSVYRHGVKRNPIWQSDRAVSPHAYFAAGGAVVGLGPFCMGKLSGSRPLYAVAKWHKHIFHNFINQRIL
jgi:hypothetical protein